MLAVYQSWIDFALGKIKENVPNTFDEAEWRDATNTFALNCAILIVLWPLCKHAWLRWSKRFAALPSGRQYYVVANMSKALCLAIMCLHPSFFSSLHHTFFQRSLLQSKETSDAQDSTNEAFWIKRCSALYLASDAVALLLVPALPTTTIFHHWMSIALGLCFFGTRLEDSNITLMIALYGAWSSLAFPVNLFLALRFPFDKSEWLPHLAWISLILYVIVCAINWSWHLAWLASQLFEKSVLDDWYGLLVLLYAGAITVLARDDIVLMSWLWDRVGKDRNQSKQQCEKQE